MTAAMAAISAQDPDIRDPDTKVAAMKAPDLAVVVSVDAAGAVGVILVAVAAVEILAAAAAVAILAAAAAAAGIRTEEMHAHSSGGR